ncbi:hypothetical protein [Isoalcanivorax indicus]|uniref:hypothetical protein n=1 Tax=Isoalcanivorax indicus TaxID=2202653 RepID=UPI000DBA59DB|nr:hypothetical protein [Isoalcanivorax indicus]
MDAKKIFHTCMFILALLFLSLIFIHMKMNSGTNNAEPSAIKIDGKMPLRDESEAAPGTRSEVAPASVSPPSQAVGGDDLKLLAVFQAYSKLASVVILKEGHGAYRYRIGDALPDGRVLAGILPTKVIINDHGEQITLRMALSSSQHGRAEAPAARADAPPARTDGDSRMSWQVVDALRRLDLSPVSEHSADGYLVGENFPAEGTEGLGVKPGDVVVSVNGYPVGEYDSDYLVWLSFRENYRASVLIRRENGEEFTVNFPEDMPAANLPEQAR